METVAQRNPTDDEAQLFYAITLNVGASPNDKTYSNQLKGAAILEQIFKRQPRHPGVAHYLIHLYDSPALADKDIDAAKRYSEIAPAAPHAQHMPSHIFTRVGYWNKSIGSNTAAARAAKADKEFTDQLHAMDYMVYAYLQLAQDSKARGVIDEMNAITGVNPNVSPGPYAIAAWCGALRDGTRRLEVGRRIAGAADPFAVCPAMTHFARAVGAAHFGKPDAPRPTSKSSRRIARQAARARDAYWAEQVDIQRQVATAFLLDAEGKHERRAQGDRRRRRCRGQDREKPGDAGVPEPGARTLRHHAARARDGDGGLAAFEATMKKEPEPPGRHRRRWESRRACWRPGESQGLLPAAHDARGQRRYRPARPRGGARVPGAS